MDFTAQHGGGFVTAGVSCSTKALGQIDVDPADARSKYPVRVCNRFQRSGNFFVDHLGCCIPEIFFRCVTE